MGSKYRADGTCIRNEVLALLDNAFMMCILDIPPVPVLVSKNLELRRVVQCPGDNLDSDVGWSRARAQARRRDVPIVPVMELPRCGGENVQGYSNGRGAAEADPLRESTLRDASADGRAKR